MTSDEATSGEWEQAARTVLDGVYAGWQHNDADEFVTWYAQDATATLPGSFLGDREAIRATMAEVFAGLFKGSRGVYEIQGVRQVGTDVLVVNTTSAVLAAGESAPAEVSRARDTWTLSRRDGSWLVDAYQSSPVSAG